MLKPRGVNSRADYGWVKLGVSPDYTFPETPYENVVDHALTMHHCRKDKALRRPVRHPVRPYLVDRLGQLSADTALGRLWRRLWM